MANCIKPNCKKPQSKDKAAGGLCDDHFRQKKAADLLLVQQKAKHDKEIKDGEAKRKQMALEATKKQAAIDLKNKTIKDLVSKFNTQVKNIANQVNKLREEHPENKNINAGNNGSLGTIPGGVNNALTFAIPKGILPAEVFPKMNGYDSSDSGKFKFRVDGVLVHGE